jgi:hypothetical protein
VSALSPGGSPGARPPVLDDSPPFGIVAKPATPPVAVLARPPVAGCEGRDPIGLLYSVEHAAIATAAHNHANEPRAIRRSFAMRGYG